MSEVSIAVISAILGGGLLTAISALVKTRSERDVNVTTAYSRLVGDLRDRIDDLEADLTEEREACAKQIAGLNDRIARLEEARA